MGVLQQSTIPTFAEKEKYHSAAARERRISSQEEEDDDQISITAFGSTFNLRKSPLVSKCGYMRKWIGERGEMSMHEITDVPGGLKGFELAVRFCYDDASVEVNTENVALALCVAEYLEMREEYAEGNLQGRAEEYLREVVLRGLHESITVLHHAEGLLPTAEKVGLVGRCVDAIASIACSDDSFCPQPPQRREGVKSPLRVLHLQQPARGFADWWAEDLTVLRVETFKRIVVKMKSRGFQQQALGTVLMLYAQKSFRGLDIFGRGRKKVLEAKKEHEKRIVLETVVSLLPKDKNIISVSFLAMLLRAAVYLETTVACRLDLERRIGLQLAQAVLDDLLIPASFLFSAGDTAFDVDSVRRILVHYLEHEDVGTNQQPPPAGHKNTDEDYSFLSTPTDLERVVKLLECYLAEIASDRNLSVAKFVGLAELIPEEARATEDGMYRAIDIYLKVHSSLSDAERKKVCGVMDCQRLSREACAHAAQNERLPMQVVVQVLYYEQQRLCDPAQMLLPSPRLVTPQDRELLRLRRENDDLRIELVKMKSQIGPVTPERPPGAKWSIVDSFSRRLGRFNPFLRVDSSKSPPVKAAGGKLLRDRRHSVS